MSEKVLGSYGQPTPPQNTPKPKSLVVNPRSFIGGGINRGIPAYLVKDEQWYDSFNMVFDFEKAFALSPRKTIDMFVATPSEVQPVGVANRTTVYTPTPVARSGQAAEPDNILYPGVPVYDHSQGPQPIPTFDPLDPYKTFADQVPVVNSDTITFNAGLPSQYAIIATSFDPIIGYAVYNLPAGLVLNPVTGQITGTITASGSSFTVVLSATNRNGVGHGTLTIIIKGYLSLSFTSFLSGPAPQVQMDCELAIDGGSFAPANSALTYTVRNQIKARYTLKTTVFIPAGGFSAQLVANVEGAAVTLKNTSFVAAQGTFSGPLAVQNQGIIGLAGIVYHNPTEPVVNDSATLSGTQPAGFLMASQALLSAPGGAGTAYTCVLTTQWDF